MTRGSWIGVAILVSLLAGIGVGRILPGRPECDRCPAAATNGPASPIAPRADDETGQTREVEGPWGSLRYVGLWLFPPLQHVNASRCKTDLPPWDFQGLSRNGLEQLLDVPDLESAVRLAVLQAAECDAAGCRVAPTADLLQRLSPGARSRIHGFLAQQPENPWVATTQRLPEGDFNLWLSQSDLEPAVRERIRSLSFPLGPLRAVADLPLLCADAPDDDAKARIFRAWSFERAQLVKVRVRPGVDDADRLTAWWGRGPRRKDVRELFASALRADQPTFIDVAHLLPYWVRALLYSYPAPEDPRYNCYWTAVNFHRNVPDPKTVSPLETVEILRKKFDLVTDGTRLFGDVLLYQLASGNVIHAAVNIADGIVFTKDGASIRRPWVLARESDVKTLYGFPEGARALVFRPKER